MQDFVCSWDPPVAADGHGAAATSSQALHSGSMQGSSSMLPDSVMAAHLSAQLAHLRVKIAAEEANMAHSNNSALSWLN
jgi:hypothetical protein